MCVMCDLLSVVRYRRTTTAIKKAIDIQAIMEIIIIIDREWCWSLSPSTLGEGRVHLNQVGSSSQGRHRENDNHTHTFTPKSSPI